MDNRITSLERKILQLEKELELKEQDLLRYKTQLNKANKSLESLIFQINSDLKALQTIQKVIVPTEYPNISGFEFSSKFIPGSEKGGDYFDIFEHEDKLKFGVILSSASGYSMSSLLLSVLLKLTGKMEARKGLEPNLVISMIIKDLNDNLRPQDRGSVFYGVIDRRTFELRYASLGSNSVLCLSAETGKINALINENQHIQFGRSSEIKINEISLNPGDRLILCSEGVLNSKNSIGEEFGIERLAKAITLAPKSGVHELRNEILFQLEKHVGTNEFPIDLTVVVTEVKERVIKLAKQ